jgi:predicted ATPase
MIEEVTIENFKSLKAVTLKLQQVNLLIGPNNSGKSNFLKGLRYFKEYIIPNSYLRDVDFREFTFKRVLAPQKFELVVNDFTVAFNLSQKEREDDGYTQDSDIYVVTKVNGDVIDDKKRNNGEYRSIEKSFKQLADSITIYSPNPLTFTTSQAIIRTSFVDSDCSNLISFLETLRDEYRESFYAIEQDLRKCIPEFKDIRFQTVNSPSDDKRTYKRWGLFSESSEIIHWADELSDGVLYFVALLCIAHQPDPPKLLLLEEPERGIHPRRIKEVMDFIFQLAEEKGVQIIMTSHNEHVLKEFAETPESVFIFDKDEEGATQVKNLLTDVIEPSDEYSEENKLDKIDFTSDIGETWFEGLMGGVPA